VPESTTGEAELTEHLGATGTARLPPRADMRNGTRSTTMSTENGPAQIEAPRDPEGSFEPVIVPKPKRRLDGIDQIVLSLERPGV
jgi:putative transposase